MRMTLASALVVVSVLAFPLSSALACGDKFVLLGRYVRFSETSHAKHPAAVLIYAKPGGELDAAQREFRFASVLKRMGHNPLVVEDDSDLQKQLAQGRWDVVLSDLSSAAEVEKQGARITPPPTVIPVLYKAPEAEIGTAQRQYGCLLKATKKAEDASDLFGVIDQAMEARAKGSGAACVSGR